MWKGKGEWSDWCLREGCADWSEKLIIDWGWGCCNVIVMGEIN